MAAAHPFMPNSTPDARAALLEAVGAVDVEALFGQIPAAHRLDLLPDLPPAIPFEVDLARHLQSILAKNRDCRDNLSFLGGGCWQHYVPAICDEVVRRSEFVTPVWGTPSSDLGRNQAWFEFASQLGELVGMEMVGLPVYSWGCAAGHALRMAVRMTGRQKVLVAAVISPERRAVIATYCASAASVRAIDVVEVAFDPMAGALDLSDLADKLGGDVAAVYFENPNFVGQAEINAAKIAAMAAAAGAETIVGVDPISLGILTAPADYGADIVVGSTQPLGVHMAGGGGLGGFIATRDEPRYAAEYPTLMLSIAETVAGERAFGMSLFHQSSYGSREAGKDWTGNSTYLWAIANAVYMAALGPQGFVEIGRLIIARAHYAARSIAGIGGVEVRYPSGFFKEFVVDFTATGRSFTEIDESLRARGIFGGLNLTSLGAGWENSALYCVTEVHDLASIDRLVAALKDACQ